MDHLEANFESIPALVNSIAYTESLPAGCRKGKLIFLDHHGLRRLVMQSPGSAIPSIQAFRIKLTNIFRTLLVIYNRCHYAIVPEAGVCVPVRGLGHSPLSFIQLPWTRRARKSYPTALCHRLWKALRHGLWRGSQSQGSQGKENDKTAILYPVVNMKVNITAFFIASSFSTETKNVGWSTQAGQGQHCRHEALVELLCQKDCVNKKNTRTPQLWSTAFKTFFYLFIFILQNNDFLMLMVNKKDYNQNKENFKKEMQRAGKMIQMTSGW